MREKKKKKKEEEKEEHGKKKEEEISKASAGFVIRNVALVQLLFVLRFAMLP